MVLAWSVGINEEKAEVRTGYCHHIDGGVRVPVAVVLPAIGNQWRHVHMSPVNCTGAGWEPTQVKKSLSKVGRVFGPADELVLQGVEGLGNSVDGSAHGVCARSTGITNHPVGGVCPQEDAERVNLQKLIHYLQHYRPLLQ